MTRKEKFGIVCLILGILISINGFQMHTITSAECNSWELYYEEECDEIAKDSRDEVAKEIGLGVFLLIIGVIFFIYGNRKSSKQ